ncbi:MAG: N-acetylmuramoyl-L-alanine amidase [Opitutaceae bacterium]
MFPELRHASPNFDAVPANECLGVICHHSVRSFEETIALMLRRESKVSYHVLIAVDGTRCTLVADEHIAWHAGASEFLGRKRCNEFTLGLAFAGDTYTAPLSDAQLASALDWLALRWDRYAWAVDRVVDHRQVSPGRKDDLNPTEWQRVLATIIARFGER